MNKVAIPVKIESEKTILFPISTSKGRANKRLRYILNPVNIASISSCKETSEMIR